MIISKTHNVQTASYWNVIKDATDEVKIKLITLLSESLSRSITKEKSPATTRTDNFVKEFYGAWQDAAGAEDIIATINHGKTSKSPISLD